jgi:hypothetical protein
MVAMRMAKSLAFLFGGPIMNCWHGGGPKEYFRGKGANLSWGDE